ETRCITHQTREGPIRADVPRQLPKSFYQEALLVRNKLLRWRFEHFAKIEADESKLLSMEPRLTQIGTPIHSVSCDREFQTAFIKFLSKNADEQRTERPQAAVVEAMRRVIDKKKKEGRMPVAVHFGPNGKLSVRDVATEATTVAHDWGILEGDEAF